MISPRPTRCPSRLVARLALPVLAAACVQVRPPPAMPANDGPCRRTVGRDGGAAEVHVAWRQPEGRREVLDAWCTSVGPAVVHARPDSAFGPLPDSLPVISWNVHAGGGDLGALLADLRAGRLTAGEPVTHFVLLVQEMHRADAALVPRTYDRRVRNPGRIEEHARGGVRRDVAALSRAYGLAMAYAPSMRNGPPGSGATEEDRGNAVLSTLPIAAVTAVELPLERQRRVAVSVVLDPRWQGDTVAPLRVTSIHLDNWTRMLPGAVESRLGSANVFRVLFGHSHARQGVSLLRALERAPEPIHLAAGDFNSPFGARAEVVSRFCEAFPDSRAATPGPTQRRGMHLDHVFVRSPYGAAPLVQLAEYGSDHAPMLTWLRLRPPPYPLPHRRPCRTPASGAEVASP